MEDEVVLNHLSCVDYAIPQEIVRSYHHIYKNVEHLQNAAGPICYGCICEDTCTDEDVCMCVSQHGHNYNAERKLIFIDDIITDAYHSKPVFECNSCCSCTKHCTNRVVQRGLQFKLQVYKTTDKGYGARTLEVIPKGCYVIDYAGEVLETTEAATRIASRPIHQNNYLLTVREMSGCKLIRTDIDAAQFGNVSRFINHSCCPNLLLHPVRIESVVPRLALFAKYDIVSGDELTFDYSGGASVTFTDAKSFKIPCNCCSSNCTGFLPAESPFLDS